MVLVLALLLALVQFIRAANLNPPTAKQPLPLKPRQAGSPNANAVKLCDVNADNYSLANPIVLNITYTLYQDIPHYQETGQHIYYNPDGVQRAMILINNEFPAPTICVTHNNMVHVRLINSMYSDTVSIHWHGILQRGTQRSDGVPDVTQPPIQPFQEYIYSFNATETGSFWYHSHSGAQYVDGLVGLLTVYPSEDDPPFPYSYDGEQNIMLQDWSHVGWLQIISAGENFNNARQSILINGRGHWHKKIQCNPPELNIRDRLDKSVFKHADPDKCSTQYSPACLSDGLYNKSFAFDDTFEITEEIYGKTWLFRIASTTAGGIFDLGFNKHTMTVVEKDGIQVLPFQTEYLTIGIGQRYVVLVTFDQPKCNDEYFLWVKPNPVLERAPTCPRVATQPAVAYLQYPCSEKSKTSDKKNKSPKIPPIPYPDGITCETGNCNDCHDSKCVIFSEFDLTTILEQDELSILGTLENTPTHDLSIAFGNLLNYNLGGLSFNHKPYQYVNNHNSLLELWSTNDTINLQRANSTLLLIPVSLNTWVNVSIAGATGHPIHFHGHNSWARSRGPGYITNFAAGDTFLHQDVNDSSRLEIVFYTNNPGVWIMHCHIDWHLLEGLALFWYTDRSLLNSSIISDGSCVHIPNLNTGLKRSAELLPSVCSDMKSIFSKSFQETLEKHQIARGLPRTQASLSWGACEESGLGVCVNRDHSITRDDLASIFTASSAELAQYFSVKKVVLYDFISGEELPAEKMAGSIYALLIVIVFSAVAGACLVKPVRRRRFYLKFPQ